MVSRYSATTGISPSAIVTISALEGQVSLSQESALLFQELLFCQEAIPSELIEFAELLGHPTVL